MQQADRALGARDDKTGQYKANKNRANLEYIWSEKNHRANVIYILCREGIIEDDEFLSNLLTNRNGIEWSVISTKVPEIHVVEEKSISTPQVKPLDQNKPYHDII